MSLFFVVSPKPKRRKISQNFLGFKLMIIYLLLAFLQVSAKSFSQNVTLSMEKVSLQEVFNEINHQTGRPFFFKDKFLNKIGKVSIKVKNMPIKEALTLCFEDLPITFSIKIIPSL